MNHYQLSCGHDASHIPGLLIALGRHADLLTPRGHGPIEGFGCELHRLAPELVRQFHRAADDVLDVPQKISGMRLTLQRSADALTPCGPAHRLTHFFFVQPVVFW